MIGKFLYLLTDKFKRRYQSFILKGTNVYCPCCKGQYQKFLSFGLSKRPNALCPNCNSLERNRLIFLYLEQKTNLYSRKNKLLHIAPEPIFFKHFRKNSNIEYYPIDKFTKGYTYPKGTLNKDITQLDFQSDQFDAILCSHVLEHIPEDHLAIQELYRVLKPGGWAILQVPLDPQRTTTFEDFSVVDPKEKEKLFGQFDHVRVYGKDYKDRLSAGGFKVVVDTFGKSFSAAEAFRFGLQYEDIYLCRK